MTFMKNDIRFASKNDFDDIRLLWDASFEEDSKKWRDWYFEYIYMPENVLLFLNDDKLASMSHINPYPMMLNSKKIMSAALAGVATYANMRKKGYAAILINESLHEMKKRGIAFSFLYPFNYDFYRKYGYELCYENNIYTVSQSYQEEFELIESDDASVMAQIYEKYTNKLNGFIKRSEYYQKKKLLEHFADSNKAYLIRKKGKTIGYAFVETHEDKISLSELVCEDPVNVAKAISAKYDKPVEFNSPYIYEGESFDTKPHCMGRVVDVIGVFNAIPAKENEMIVKVKDDIIKDNNTSFLFCAKDGKLDVSRTNSREDISVDIKELSIIATGYLEGMSKSARELYDAFFMKKTPWIIEVC